MDNVKEILEQYKNGTLNIDDAAEMVNKNYFTDLGHTIIDNNRKKRTGFPEVIYGAGKTSDQIAEIFKYIAANGENVLATRVTEQDYDTVKAVVPKASYDKMARIIYLKQHEFPLKNDHYIAVVTAGTSDLPVAEEAAITAEFYGNKVVRISDVGVAGIHRLFKKLEIIRGARVVICAAGMEGALPSVIGGLVDKPVIALPTSVGYGANMNGITALLGMLTSCSSGISVVNIDNGFGAGYQASMINRL